MSRGPKAARDEVPEPTGRRVGAWVRWAERRLACAGLSFGHGAGSALDEAAWLVLHAAGLRPDSLGQSANRALDDNEIERARELVEARVSTRRPAAYLTGQAWFAGLPFHVDERVIVPRSHLGEWITDGFQPWIDPAGIQEVLDLCTGSGCIAIALALEFPDARVDAVDISADALDVARMNVERHGLARRVRLLEGDLFAAVEPTRRYDLICANPPYVSTSAMAALPPEYRHEPAVALAAGNTGLDLIERILRDAGEHLAAAGHLVIEAASAAPALERRHPAFPFTWLAASDGTAPVLLVSAPELERLARMLPDAGGGSGG